MTKLLETHIVQLCMISCDTSIASVLRGDNYISVSIYSLSQARGGPSVLAARSAGTPRLRRRTRAKNTARRTPRTGPAFETRARWLARPVSSSPPLVRADDATGRGGGTLEMRPGVTLIVHVVKDMGLGVLGRWVVFGSLSKTNRDRAFLCEPLRTRLCVKKYTADHTNENRIVILECVPKNDKFRATERRGAQDGPTFDSRPCYRFSASSVSFK